MLGRLCISTTVLVLGLAAPTLGEQYPYLGLGMSGAGLNSPVSNVGNSDNLSFIVRGNIPIGKIFSIKPSVFLGQYSIQAAPAVTYTFPLEKEINGYLGAGYTFLLVTTGGNSNNNVLGNTAAPIAIGGVEFFPGNNSAIYIDIIYTRTGFEGQYGAASLNMGWALRF